MKYTINIRSCTWVITVILFIGLLFAGSALADYDEDTILTEWELQLIEYLSNSVISSDGLYEYVIKEDGTGILIHEDVKSRDVVLPGEIDGVIITEIMDYLYSDVHDIRSVTIPDGVRKIPQYAFEYSSLENVTLPEGLEEIGD